MKRPLLPVALLYIVGILCGEIAHPSLPVLFGVSLLTAAFALAYARGRVWLTALLIILTGWTGACWRVAILAPDDLRLQLQQRTEQVRLRGVIQAPPAQRIFERGGR
jgi:hypothetical protein